MQDFVAFTGHRPNKLGGYGSDTFSRLVDLAEAYLTENRAVWGIFGMALGWDMAGAQAAVNLRLPFVAAVPFVGQESRWPIASQNQYRLLLDAARDVVIVSPGGYSAKKMQIRNEWMVDNATRLAALHDGTPGGTGNCVAYAAGRLPIDNLWSRWC